MPIDIQLNIKVETKSLSIRQQDMSYISASSIILKSTFRYHRTSFSLIKTAQLQRDRTIPWNKFFPKQCCSITATQISAVVATVKRRTDREGGGRKIGEKIQRGEKKKMWNRMILSRIRATGNRYRRSRGRPPPLRRALPEVLHSPMKIPIHPSFHPIFNSVCPFHNRYRIFLHHSFRSSPYVSTLLAIYDTGYIVSLE